MKDYPKDEERDWAGVCQKCGQLKLTIIINKKNGAVLSEDDRPYNVSQNDTEDIELDFREVTACCRSEDFIPFEYVANCLGCLVFIDERHSVHSGGGFICDACINKEREACPEEETIPLAVSPLSNFKPRGR